MPPLESATPMASVHLVCSKVLSTERAEESEKSVDYVRSTPGPRPPSLGGSIGKRSSDRSFLHSFTLIASIFGDLAKGLDRAR